MHYIIIYFILCMYILYIFYSMESHSINDDNEDEDDTLASSLFNKAIESIIDTVGSIDIHLVGSIKAALQVEFNT